VELLKEPVPEAPFHEPVQARLGLVPALQEGGAELHDEGSEETLHVGIGADGTSVGTCNVGLLFDEDPRLGEVVHLESLLEEADARQLRGLRLLEDVELVLGSGGDSVGDGGAHVGELSGGAGRGRSSAVHGREDGVEPGTAEVLDLALMRGTRHAFLEAHLTFGGKEVETAGEEGASARDGASAQDGPGRRRRGRSCSRGADGIGKRGHGQKWSMKPGTENIGIGRVHFMRK
jgi:hypothetical protein